MTTTLVEQIALVRKEAPEGATLIRFYLTRNGLMSGARYYRPSDDYGLEFTLGEDYPWKPAMHHRADLLLDEENAVLIRTNEYFGG